MKDARILIVDDEADVLALLKEHLELQGYGVVTTSSAIEAESILSSSVIDLAMLDVGVHGLRLARKARSFDKPFILMSGSPVIVEMGEFGPVLRKPFKLEALTRAVERALRRHEPPSFGAETAVRLAG